MEIFNIDGNYNHGEDFGEFKGKMGLCGDGRIFGSVMDYGSDVNPTKKNRPKLIIGLKERDSLNFWKFPLNPEISSLVYATAREGSVYVGKWGMVSLSIADIIEGVSGRGSLMEISEVVKSEDFKSNKLEGLLPILEKVSKDRVEAYMSKWLLRDISRNSRNYGKLILSKLI